MITNEEHAGAPAEQSSESPQDEEQAAGAFKAAEILAALKAKAATATPVQQRTELPLADICEYPDLFQPRGVDERHVQELVRAIKVNGKVDPITVVQVGAETIVIDGHHRRAAYKLAKVVDGVPVVHFGGTLEEAVLEAGRANAKAKLPMANQERNDFAWRLVRMGGYKKKEIVEAAGVSERQVAYMRKTKRQLHDRLIGVDRWWQALAALKNLPARIEDDDERAQRLEQMAQGYADRLSKQFGSKLPNNAEVAAHALAIYFGRRLPALFHELRGYVGEFDDYDLLHNPNDDF